MFGLRCQRQYLSSPNQTNQIKIRVFERIFAGSEYPKNAHIFNNFFLHHTFFYNNPFTFISPTFSLSSRRGLRISFSLGPAGPPCPPTRRASHAPTGRPSGRPSKWSSTNAMVRGVSVLVKLCSRQSLLGGGVQLGIQTERDYISPRMVFYFPHLSVVINKWNANRGDRFGLSREEGWGPARNQDRRITRTTFFSLCIESRKLLSNTSTGPQSFFSGDSR